MAAELSNCKTF